MKKYLLIVVVLFTIASVNAQNPIYNGGNADGYSANGFVESSNNIFNGGNGDGYATTTLTINLPVRFAFFKASAVSKGVLVEWQTFFEQLSDRFEIEKSLDGLNFQKIGTVKSKGAASTPTNYSFVDTRAAKGYNYYRLKQVDKNNDFVYTPIVSVLFDEDLVLTLAVYPQPARSFVMIELPAALQGKRLTVNFVNANGMLVKQIVTKENISGNKLQVSLQDLRAGTYVVQVVSVGNSFKSILIIQ